MPTFRDVISRLKRERIDLGTDFLALLGIAVTHFERPNGAVELTDLTPDHVLAMMRDLKDGGRAVDTVNGYRRRILYLWQRAKEMRFEVPPVPREDVCRLKTIQRMPTAWHPPELGALLLACDKIPPCKGWGAAADRALISVAYDTSCRVGAILKAKLTHLDIRNQTLLIPGDKQKGRCDTYQKLHPDTVSQLLALKRPSGDDRLIPLTFSRRNLFKRIGLVLQAAGLPATRRDKFHRIRRTSYTLVAVAFGIQAASQHAAHKGDLSKYYLDPTFLDRPNPLDALPRPA